MNGPGCARDGGPSDQVGPEGRGLVLGAVVAEHGPHRDPLAPVVAEQLVDEADRVGPGHRAETMATKAQRVNTSMAVSWYTLPTPFRFPT